MGGEVLSNIIVKPRMFCLGIVLAEGDQFLPIQPSLSENVLTKLLEMGCLGYAWHWRRFYLGYSIHLVWWYKSCTWKCSYGSHWYERKSPSWGSRYMGLCENIQVCLFLPFSSFLLLLSMLFLSVYILLLALLYPIHLDV